MKISSIQAGFSTKITYKLKTNSYIPKPIKQKKEPLLKHGYQRERSAPVYLNKVPAATIWARDRSKFWRKKKLK